MDKFTTAYIDCLLWSSELENYSINDIEEESLKSIIEDCQQFQEENQNYLNSLNQSQCGHDFWLTRNHHGSGFWDRGLGEVGQSLTRAAEAYNECDAFEQNNKIIVE